MNERDELMALRRMAELEAKASGQQRPMQTPEQGFFDGLKSDIQGRADRLGQNFAKADMGQITGGELAVRGLRDVAGGLVNDPFGRAAGSLGRFVSGITPDFIEQPVVNAAKKTFQDFVNPFGIPVAETATNLYSKFKKNAPEMAEDVEAIGELTFAGPALAGIAGAAKQNLGPVFDKAGKSVSNTAKTIAKGIKPLDADDLKATAREIKGGYGKKIATIKGSSLSPDASKELASSIKKSLSELDLDPDLHPQTLKVLSRIENEVRGGTITVKQADTYRKLFSDAARKDINSIGEIGADGNAALAGKRTIDDFLDNLEGTGFSQPNVAETLRSARSDYSAGKKYERIARLVQKGDGDIAKIQNTIKTFVRNDKNLQGFNLAEKSALKKFANGGPLEGVLGLFSKAGIDPNNLRSTMNIVRGGASLIPGVAPVVAGGTAAKVALDTIKRGQLQNILEQIKGAR